VETQIVKSKEYRRTKTFDNRQIHHLVREDTPGKPRQQLSKQKLKSGHEL
jgi:hypothetical protein